jgi:hypothetical protein
MIQVPQPDVAALMTGGHEVDQSLRLAFARTVLLHRLLGLPLVVWRDEQVAEIPADGVVLDPLAEAAARR